MCNWSEYKLSALQVRMSEENILNATTQQFIIAQMRVKTGEWNTLTSASEQFTTAKWGCANVLSNTSSGAQKVCGWTGWRTPRFARSDLAKLHKNWECAWSTQVNFFLFVMYRSPANFCFPFSLLRHYWMPGCFCVSNCCFWARATVLSCYRNWQCSQCG